MKNMHDHYISTTYDTLGPDTDRHIVAAGSTLHGLPKLEIRIRADVNEKEARELIEFALKNWNADSFPVKVGVVETP